LQAAEADRCPVQRLPSGKLRVDRNTRWIPNSSSNRAIVLDKLLPSLHLAGAPETDRVSMPRGEGTGPHDPFSFGIGIITLTDLPTER
jgi:hypothetical protein